MIGAVLEIETPDGFAYGQYVSEHREPPQFGSLVRIFRGLYPERLTPHPDFVNTVDLMVGFFPLSVWLTRGVATKVVVDGQARLVDHDYVFKLGDDGSGTTWALWDEQSGERFVGTLSEDEVFQYPTLVVYDELALIAEILQRSGSPDDFDATRRWYRNLWETKRGR